MTPGADDPVLVLTTLGASADADVFARTLVEERLAACVSVLPLMASHYRWGEALQRDDERQLLIKTSAARVAALESRFRTLHPYDTPELLVVPIAGGSARYLAWLASALAVAPPGDGGGQQ